MHVLILTVFISLVLVFAAILFFGWNVRHGAHDHADRLALLPLQSDDAQSTDCDSTHGKDRHADRTDYL